MPPPAPPRNPLTGALLGWYDRHRRTLPWRTRKGRRPDPYRVWLSEIMLQQTTVAAVGDYFRAFTRRWPNFAALAAAPDAEVMQAWAGLGYYARARNMLRTARLVVREHGGRLPADEAALRGLPGIGHYTAGAILSIAFDKPAAPVDGNIARVLARLHDISTPSPRLEIALRPRVADLTSGGRAGDIVQALMDLGATICTPTRPDCAACPWKTHCAAHAAGTIDRRPRKPAKKPRPERRGKVYWLENARGHVLMLRRPDRGLLGGMLTFPSSGWDSPNDTDLADKIPDGWCAVPDEVAHVFTHFRLTLSIFRRRAPKGFRAPKGHEWVAPNGLHALPSVMQKVARQVRR